MTTARKEVKERVVLERADYLTIDSFAGDIETVIERLEELQEKYLDTYERLELAVEQDYDYMEVYLQGVRLETDLEYAKRLSKNKKRRETRQRNARKRQDVKTQRDLRELERLINTYGMPEDFKMS